MRYTQVRLVLTFLGWLSSGGLSALAQDPTLSLRNPPFADTVTATHPGAAPTPQLLGVKIGLEAGGRTIQMRYDPAWVALHSPQVRVGQAPTKRAPAVDVAPPLQGGVEELHQVLEQALARAQPSAVPSPYDDLIQQGPNPPLKP
jgi:hypothetical protein